MSFNVNDFKQGVKGFLRPHTYIVNVTPPYGGLSNQALSLRTQSITAPGVSFAEVDNYKIYGSGLQISVPHTTTIQEITCVHTVDNDGDVLQTFYDWVNNIVDISGVGKYSPNYYDEYTVDMSIDVFNLANERVKRYDIRKAYPQSLSPIELSWASNEIVELSVTYKFETFILV